MPPFANNIPPFNGSRNLPHGTVPSVPVVMSWNVLSTDAQPLAFNVPGLKAGSFPWYVFAIDPVSQQGAFTFGEALAMQIQISRPLSYYISDVSCFVAGRVVVYVPSTGQTFVWSAKQYLDVVITDASPIECENAILPVFLGQGSKLQVWLESDNSDGNASLPGSTVLVALFNQKLPPVATS